MLNKAIVSATLLILAASIFSCSSYPENPLVALGSKESRVANTWKVTYATDGEGNETTEQQTGDKYLFSEDGTAEFDTKISGVNVEIAGDVKTEGTRDIEPGMAKGGGAAHP